MTIPEGSVGILKLAESAELLRLAFSLRRNGLWSQSCVFAFLLHHILAVTSGQACPPRPRMHAHIKKWPYHHQLFPVAGINKGKNKAPSSVPSKKVGTQLPSVLLF